MGKYMCYAHVFKMDEVSRSYLEDLKKQLINVGQTIMEYDDFKAEGERLCEAVTAIDKILKATESTEISLSFKKGN